MKQIVARKRSIAARRSSGPAFSTTTKEPPIRIGKITMPSPNVKARGAEPMNRSDGSGLRIICEKPSQTASMSRWACMQPFGSPVVPDVNAMRQMSSAAVSTAAKSGLARSTSRSREASSPAPQYTSRVRPGVAPRAFSISSARLASHSATAISALLIG